MHSPTTKSMIPQEAAHCAKKVRLSSSEQSSVDERGNPDGSHLEKMPDEMLFEIFSRLFPRDLLILSHTNKFLRRFLMSRKNSSIWKMALKLVDAPKCPEFMSIPHWVDLIFGNRICYLCGTSARNDMWYWFFDDEIDWDIQRRLCSKCRKSAALGVRPINNVIADEAMFMKSTVTKYQKHILKERAQEMTDRLVSRGWRKDAVERAVPHPEYEEDICINVFTEMDWKRKLPKLERDAKWHERRIRQAEYDGRVKLRMDIGEKIYVNYLETSYPPSRWPSFPPWSNLSRGKPISSLIHSRGVNNVTKEELQASLDVFTDTLDTWRKKKSDKLHNLLPESFRTRHNAPVTETSDGCLGLAIAVFQRERPKDPGFCRCNVDGGPTPLMGWAEAASHHCWRYGNRQWHRAPDTEIKFNERGSAAAGSMVRLLGFNEETALPADLDRMERVFFCEDCPVQYRGGKWEKQAFSWRDCVKHYMDPSAAETHQEPRWSILNSAQAREANHSTGGHFDGLTGAWNCNLCTSAPPHDRKAVIAHVKQSHGIRSPVLTRDYFLNRTKLVCNPPMMPRIPVPPSGQKRKGMNLVYKCKHCRESRHRQYPLDDMVSHLKKRHSISTPTYPTDCVEEWVPKAKQSKKRKTLLKDTEARRHGISQLGQERRSERFITPIEMCR